MIASSCVSICLISVAVWMIRAQAKVCPERTSPDSAATAKFMRARFVRRRLTSLLIGAVGIAVLLTHMMLDPKTVRFWFFWSGLFGAVILLMFAAFVDGLANLRYYELVRREIVEARKAIADEFACRKANQE